MTGSDDLTEAELDTLYQSASASGGGGGGGSGSGGGGGGGGGSGAARSSFDGVATNLDRTNPTVQALQRAREGKVEWKSEIDPNSGDVYYYNDAGETRWDNPDEDEDVVSPAVAATATVTAAAAAASTEASDAAGGGVEAEDRGEAGGEGVASLLQVAGGGGGGDSEVFVGIEQFQSITGSGDGE